MEYGYQSNRPTGIPSFLIDLFMARKDKKGAENALYKMYAGLEDDPANASMVQKAQALQERDPREALKYLKGASSVDTRQRQQMNDLAIGESQRTADLVAEMDALYRGGADKSERGQQRIDDIMSRLAPTTSLNHRMAMREKPVGSPYMDANNNMVAATYSPGDGFQTHVLGAGNPKYQFSEMAGGIGRTSPTDPNPTMVMSPPQVGSGKGRSEAAKQDELASYDARAKLLDSVDEEKAVLKAIDEGANHPGLESYYGLSRLNPGYRLPGTDFKDYEAYLQQAQGQSFMTAYEALKGGGTITEIETKKAEQAITRLSNTDLSEAEAKKAWKELREAVEAGYDKLRRRANTSAAGRATKVFIPGKGIVDANR